MATVRTLMAPWVRAEAREECTSAYREDNTCYQRGCVDGKQLAGVCCWPSSQTPSVAARSSHQSSAGLGMTLPW